MKRLTLALAGLLAGVAMLAGVAQANTASAYLYVYTNVIPFCQVYTNSVYFQDYAGNFIQTTGSVNVGCSTSETPLSIALDAGLNYDGFYRRMSNGLGNSVYYDLIDPPFFNYWGDDGVTHWAPSYNTSSSSAGTWDSFTVNAWLYGGQIVPEGWYSDSVYVTVTY
jgi:spore coat protein U-like protein